MKFHVFIDGSKVLAADNLEAAMERVEIAKREGIATIELFAGKNRWSTWTRSKIGYRQSVAPRGQENLVIVGR